MPGFQSDFLTQARGLGFGDASKLREQTPDLSGVSRWVLTVPSRGVGAKCRSVSLAMGAAPSVPAIEFGVVPTIRILLVVRRAGRGGRLPMIGTVCGGLNPLEIHNLPRFEGFLGVQGGYSQSGPCRTRTAPTANRSSMITASRSTPTERPTTSTVRPYEGARVRSSPQASRGQVTPLTDEELVSDENDDNDEGDVGDVAVGSFSRRHPQLGAGSGRGQTNGARNGGFGACCETPSTLLR